MKVVFTGGGTGGHVYPLIAVAEQLRVLHPDNLSLTYMASTPYDIQELERLNITWSHVPAGRLEVSLRGLVGTIKTLIGIVIATAKLLFLYPDVIFSKGGYAAAPVLFASRILRIPVFIHESDSIPGRGNLWAGKFAARVGVTFPGAAKHFDPSKTKVTGQPVRMNILPKNPQERTLEKPPRILVVGGSQGAQRLNDIILASLKDLTNSYFIVHQTGEQNYKEVSSRASVILSKSAEQKERYFPKSFFSSEEMQDLFSTVSVVVTRGGSGLFEFAAWGLPMVIVPITLANDHQKHNAYYVSKKGAATVIEEENLSPSVLLETLSKITKDPFTYSKMSKAALTLGDAGAAETIAEELIEVATYHK